MNEQIKEMYFSTGSCKIIADYYNLPLSSVKRIVKENVTQAEIEKIKNELAMKKAVADRKKQKDRYKNDKEYRERMREYARNYYKQKYANIRNSN